MKFLVILFSLIFLSSCSLNNSTQILPTPTMTPQNPIVEENTSTQSAVVNTETVVALDTINGQIVIKLYQDQTPNTVANFLKKVNSGFYDGLIFHRVIPGFMAQGGDPTGTGTGGGSQKSELNQIPFKRGSLGLARTPASKEISNDSQFFICFTDEGCQHLTGDYVNFGEVISGLDVLDKIVQGDKILKISTTTK
ncbi:MAG TPA: peptidylprolyl isomerase [Candidatus Woesebacteria bacterium]|nr:peptidylprolyl isomerase [Candidatus Woesebacteria bacterium]HPR99880.1 peptidylprolyl isomerase [Candidatus Woesebacteria bacterium]